MILPVCMPPSQVKQQCSAGRVLKRTKTCLAIGKTWMKSSSMCPFISICLNLTFFIRFLYVLILAMDANFRLTNRMRANEHDDVELGPGWGCMVDSAPYKEHLKNYISETDVSPSIPI